MGHPTEAAQKAKGMGKNRGHTGVHERVQAE